MAKCAERNSINDDYEHLDSSLEYVLENVPMSENEDEDEVDYEFKELCDRFHSYLINGCDCRVLELCCSECHRGNYIESGLELVLKETEFVIECSGVCKCNKETCKNRLVQYGPRENLEVIDSPRFKSKGLITTKFIPKGGFICEYAGELLTSKAAKERLKKNTLNKAQNYIMCVKESPLEKEGANVVTIVDPSQKGNIGRYLNHSCDPNCHICIVRVDCPIPKIAIFANRNIIAQEELCFNYAGITTKLTKLSETPCLCNTKNCIKFLPGVEFCHYGNNFG